MEEKIPWEKIKYYLKNIDANWDDEFISWLNEKEENKQIWEEIKLTYNLTGNLPKPFKPNKKSAWEKVDQRTSVNTKKLTINKFFLRIAASIILVLFGASASWLIFHTEQSNQFTEIYSPFGHKTMVILPDSSKVWLNGNTHIKYKTNFTTSRDVFLVGEALFKVTKDKKHAFSVQSDHLKVKVYGTEFNFKHYKNDTEAEVSLLEGSVGLFSNNKLLTKMQPGQVAEYNTQKQALQISKKDINPIISWSSDELIIDNKKFEDVLKYLERWYGVNIKTSKDLNIKQRLSFKVKTESLQELLSIIDKISPIQYKVEGKQVIISKN